MLLACLACPLLRSINKTQRSRPVVTNNNVVACIKTGARGAMRGRKSTLLSIFSCRGFRAREDLTNRVPAVPHASAPKEPTSQTWQLVHGTPPSWRTHVAQDAGSRRGGVRSRFLLQLSCREHTTHTTHAAQGLAFPLFARLRWGHETCTLSANRAEPPCPALRFSMARAGITAHGWVAGGPGPRFVSFRKPNQHRPHGASDNPRFQDGPHRSPFHRSGHTSQPDGLDRLGIDGRDDLEVKKSLHSPSIVRVRRIRCAAPRQPWATSGRLLGNFWATLGAGLGGRRMTGCYHQFRPVRHQAVQPRQQANGASTEMMPVDKPHGGASVEADR